jgi:hypothetical protein
MSHIPADTDAKKLYDELEDWRSRNKDRASGRVNADLYRRVDEVLRDFRRKGQELWDALAANLMKCDTDAEKDEEKKSYGPKFADLCASNEQRFRALLDEIDGRQAPAPRAPRTAPPALELIPGGFAYRGHPYGLTGKPLILLRELLKARFSRCAVDQLRQAGGWDDDFIEFPKQAVKDAVKDLRAALRKAIRDAGESCKNPLPSIGKGADLTYQLSLP